MKTLAGVLVGLMLFGCGNDENGPPGGKDNVTLETSRAVSDSIGPSGGTLTATSTNGVSYTASFPAGAVKTPVEITMTPLADIENLDVTTLAGGVEFQPSGLVLGTPATLTISNAGAPGAGLTAIAFNADGAADSVAADFAAESGGTFTVLVRHFSLSGLAYATIGQIQALTPPTGGNTQSQFFINSLLQLVAQSPRNFLAEITNMQAWFHHVILAGVQNATTDVQLLFALSEYNFWRQVTTTAHLIADDPLFAVQRDSFALAALPKLQQAVVDNNSECLSNRSLGFANNVLFWQTVAQDLGLATAGNGLDRAGVLQGLCIQVLVTDSTYPNPATPNQAANFDLLSGIQFGSDPNLLTTTFSYTVDITGSTNDRVVQSLSDAQGAFFTAITPTGQQPLLLLTTACLFVPEVPYSDVCSSFLLSRNFGGCGTVIQGNASIQSPAELAAMANVSEITGSLGINGGVGVVDLPCLGKVGGTVAIGSSVVPWLSPGIVRLSSLDTIVGSLVVQTAAGVFDVQVPALTSVGDISIIGNPDLQLLTLSGFTARDLNINQNSALTTATIGDAAIRGMNVMFNPSLTSLALSNLSPAPGVPVSVLVFQNTALTGLTITGHNSGPNGSLIIMGNSTLSNLGSIASSTVLGGWFFDFTNAFDEAAALALANRITVGRVCNMLNPSQINVCYQGPPWHP